MTTKIVNATVKGLKVLGSVVATAAIVEVGFLGGRMLANDVECTVKAVDAKVNPKVMKKRHWYSRKPELFNTRTQKFVADKKLKTKKSK